RREASPAVCVCPHLGRAFTKWCAGGLSKLSSAESRATRFRLGIEFTQHLDRACEIIVRRRQRPEDVFVAAAAAALDHWDLILLRDRAIIKSEIAGERA